MHNNYNISIGIDVSKAKLDVYITKINKYIQFSNTVEGIQQLLDLLEDNPVNKKTPIVIESTGGYESLCTDMLCNKGFNIKLINPLILKAYSNKNIRKTKTDIIDCKLLAEIGIKEDLFSYKTSNTQKELKNKYHLLQTLIKTRSEYRQRLKTLVDTKGLNNIDIEKNIFKEIINTLTIQIKELEKLIVSNKAIKDKIALLEELNGVSDISIAGLLIELGDIINMCSFKQLVAFAGLDPSVRESGISVRGKSRLSKRGSKTLRRVLFGIGWGLFMHNKLYKDYYDKKKAEGKHYYTCLIAIARKFLYVFYAVVRKNEKFRNDYRV